MRPPTEVERLVVFLAAMTVTRLLLPRTAHPVPPIVRRSHHGHELEDNYRARYGANNPGAN